MNTETTNPVRPQSVFANRKSGLQWHIYEVSICADSLIGGKSPGSLHSNWVEGAFNDGEKRVRKAALKSVVSEAMNGEQVSIDEANIANEKATVFERHNETGTPAMGTANIKAALKESASILWPDRKWTKTGKQTRSWLPERLFVEAVDGGDQVPMTTLDGQVVEPYIYERPVHVPGQKAALSASERVDDAVMTFHIKVLVSAQDLPFTDDDLADLLECMSYQGLGAERSLGHGRFIVTQFDRLK